jgi:hypothetical protein
LDKGIEDRALFHCTADEITCGSTRKYGIEFGYQLGKVGPSCNSSTWELRKKDQGFEANLSNITRSSLKKEV